MRRRVGFDRWALEVIECGVAAQKSEPGPQVLRCTWALRQIGTD
jgi:hypothetical protein